MSVFDSFDDISIEDDPQYLAYQARLEYQEWYNEIGWIKDINAELREIAEAEHNLEVSECLLTCFEIDQDPCV